MQESLMKTSLFDVSEETSKSLIKPVENARFALPSFASRGHALTLPSRAGALPTAAARYQGSERTFSKQRPRGALRVGEVHAWGPCR